MIWSINLKIIIINQTYCRCKTKWRISKTKTSTKWNGPRFSMELSPKTKRQPLQMKILRELMMITEQQFQKCMKSKTKQPLPFFNSKVKSQTKTISISLTLIIKIIFWWTSSANLLQKPSNLKMLIKMSLLNKNLKLLSITRTFLLVTKTRLKNQRISL